MTNMALWHSHPYVYILPYLCISFLPFCSVVVKCYLLISFGVLIYSSSPKYHVLSAMFLTLPLPSDSLSPSSYFQYLLLLLLSVHVLSFLHPFSFSLSLSHILSVQHSSFSPYSLLSSLYFPPFSPLLCIIPLYSPSGVNGKGDLQTSQYFS